jgi:hypothetical protein
MYFPFRGSHFTIWLLGSKHAYPVRDLEVVSCAGIFKQSMGAGNQVELGFSYRPARLCSLAELVPWNRFLGSLKVKKFGFCLREGTTVK